MTISSADFNPGGRIPATFTCSGAGKSPALSWSGMPAGTKSLALIIRDPDAPRGTWVHWVIYNLPGTATGLPQAVPPAPKLADGTLQGVNSGGQSGYQGPCPPPGPAHHYHFRLYALDRRLPLGAGADVAAFERAARGHVLASGELIGTFAR